MALDAQDFVAGPLENVIAPCSNAAMPADRKAGCTDDGVTANTDVRVHESGHDPRRLRVVRNGQAKHPDEVFGEMVMQQGTPGALEETSAQYRQCAAHSVDAHVVSNHDLQGRPKRKSYIWRASCATLRISTSRDTLLCKPQ